VGVCTSLILTAFEFVTFFSFLVVLIFLLFAMREKNRALGVFLLPQIHGRQG